MAPDPRFRSPWQSPLFVRWVAFARAVLSGLPGREDRFIDRLVTDQNARVRDFLAGRPARKVLLIMPRCVKMTGCRAAVQESLEECLACRRCPLGDVAHLCRDHGVKALVAFRSHIAFEMARTEQPDVIIASACRDRMIKALRSTPDHPALLAPLTGMRKMCLDAGLDMVWLKQQLEFVAPPAEAPDAPATPAARELPADDAPLRAAQGS
ncbi:DUF116 domain-containing protein [bacterium]|nr:DUF116 domain-containing protein [bacterium]